MAFLDFLKKKRPALEPGQESVWDYPRPPRIEDCAKRIQVVFNGVVIANSYRAKRVLETSHPPTYYVPPEDIKMQLLTRGSLATVCEWKGRAAYYSVDVGGKQEYNAAWCYPNPTPAFEAIKDHVAFYPNLMEACFVDEERARPQPGGFYGGWVTHEIVGPFKGDPEAEGRTR